MKRSNGFTVIEIVIAVAVIGALVGGYFVFKKKPKTDISTTQSETVSTAPQTTPTPEKTSETKPVVKETPAPAKEEAKVPQAIVYKNSTYGFSLTFPDSWKDYKAEAGSNNQATASFDFKLPAKDTTFGNPVSLFAISVYTKDQWSAVQADEGPKPTLIKEGATHVFAYDNAQAYPDELSDEAKQVKDIIATFKLD